MTALRTIKKLLVGETLILPLGVAAILAAGGVVRHVAASAWPAAGGPFLAVGVVAILLASSARTARRR
jgi:membrane protein implicated in regulation of membrane protease activity